MPRLFRRRAFATIALLVLTLAATPSTAWAHAVLLETTPADGASFDTPPERVAVLFNEPIKLLFLRVLNGEGRSLVPADTLISADERIEAPLPKLPAGTYVASYRVVSMDGHPIGGSIVFRVGVAGANAGAPVLDDGTEIGRAHV